ncbi:MAG: glycosyltransferase family 4 protein [Pirellulales bacterium]|nr:glycosyltransferase family 4 protein [Pirellulales bacterium]
MIASPAKIAIGTYFRFAEGGAPTARVVGYAKALRDAGYEVVFLSAEKNGRPEHLGPDGNYYYRGFPYYLTDEIGDGSLSFAGKLIRYLQAGRRTADWFRARGTDGFRAFISAGGYSGYYARLKSFLERRGVAYISDCIDWFGWRQMGGADGLLQSMNVELTMRILNKRTGNLIAISRFFENYYSRRGCRVVRVPPLVDMEDPAWSGDSFAPPRENSIRLVYAGSPGRKDLLAPVLFGIRELAHKGIDVTLNLIGLTSPSLKSHLGKDAGILIDVEKHLVYRGRIPQDEVPRLLAESDFTILVRPNAKYAQAGFPTKVVESLAAGVPVITNRTSDISEFVEDGREGILLAGNAAADFVEGILRLEAMERTRWLEMRAAARRRAEASFDYRRYSRPLADFIEAASQRPRGDRGL